MNKAAWGPAQPVSVKPREREGGCGKLHPAPQELQARVQGLISASSGLGAADSLLDLLPRILAGCPALCQGCPQAPCDPVAPSPCASSLILRPRPFWRGCCVVCQVRANSVAIAERLMSKGYKLVTDGTENHLVLWDLRPLGLTGTLAPFFSAIMTTVT